MRKQRVGRPKTRITRECYQCRKEFEALPSEIARGAGRYCSGVCADVSRGRIRTKETLERPRQPPIEIICETCLTPFRVYRGRANPARQARFCSLACRTAPPSSRLGVKRRRR